MGDASFRSGYATIVGWPNVGKSTFLNQVLGTKLSIVSPRPQTTRESILGILNAPNRQLIFVDTPGWLSPKDTIQSFMKRAVVRSLYDDADLLVWLIDPRPLGDEERAFGDTLVRSKKPVFAAINKIDTVSDRSSLAALDADVRNILGDGARLWRMAARSGEGVATFKQALLDALPESPPYFPTDQITDRWERFFVAELIREQMFRLFQQEVPHASTVLIEEFVEKPGRKDVIKAHVLVETEGQKKIVVGEKGRGVKALGESARREIEERLGRPVFLELIVKVQKNWRNDAAFLKKLEESRGYF